MLEIASITTSLFGHQALAALPRLEVAKPGDLVGVGFLASLEPRDDILVMNPLDSLELLIKTPDGIACANPSDHPHHVREACFLLWSLTLHGFLYATAHMITHTMTDDMDNGSEDYRIHILRDQGIVVHDDPQASIYEGMFFEEGITTESLAYAVALLVPDLPSAHARLEILPTARLLVDTFRPRFLTQPIGDRDTTPISDVELSLNFD